MKLRTSECVADGGGGRGCVRGCVRGCGCGPGPGRDPFCRTISLIFQQLLYRMKWKILLRCVLVLVLACWKRS